ncbi:Crp/Fnr family transcriptional regulator [Sphingomonas sp. BAUL-RG-20F-R05-02]|uniref:Crp/Fnr family transcriptional regulator n=1 Tax=Sphingomonas sp. BAUL-RG-20F-R05-02 TaxID=2914830 RepID=UPI001F578788|nr:Crp/Fnr family transcriptional regulator [Sphingomonas sp. BAUL-RG-20F-R05-02]
MARCTTNEAIALFLNRLVLRSSLGDAERAAILDLAKVSEIDDVERDFVRVGDRLSHACLVVDGMVARFAQIQDGARSFVALHIPGDLADLFSIVEPNVTWALHALCPTRILRIPHHTLRELVERYPALGMAFWRDTVTDANILAQWTVNIGRKDALASVAHLLAEMAMRHQANGLGSGKEYPFPITQADLADAVALTPVHLNRVLKRLREDNIAVKEANSVRILDFQRLAYLGEFDPAYLQLARDDRT